jgi:hypothetical protein
VRGNSLAGRAIITWFLFIPVAIANGAVREKVFRPRTSDLTAHQLSTATGSAAFLTVAWVMLRGVVSGASSRALALVGGTWLLNTMAFEFGFGHFVMHAPWSKLLADYDVRKGRLWTVVLATIALAPLIVQRATRCEA